MWQKPSLKREGLRKSTSLCAKPCGFLQHAFVSGWHEQHDMLHQLTLMDNPASCRILHISAWIDETCQFKARKITQRANDPEGIRNQSRARHWATGSHTNLCFVPFFVVSSSDLCCELR